MLQLGLPIQWFWLRFWLWLCFWFWLGEMSEVGKSGEKRRAVTQEATVLVDEKLDLRPVDVLACRQLKYREQ